MNRQVPRYDELEDESNTDRWMISYADFITLLFAFFVVMYAISSVNDEKYKVLSDTLQKAFDVEVASLTPIQIGNPTTAPSPHIVDVPDTRGYADADPGNTEIRDPIDAAESLLGGFAAQQGVDINSDCDWLELTFDASLLFAPGSVDLPTSADAVLTPVLELVKATRQPVTIEGYTDNVPSESAIYQSNWALSAARAAVVADFFNDRGIRRERLAAVGYGESHPIATNATPNGRSQNRRVVVVVARRADCARNLNVTPVKAPVRSQAAVATVATPQRTLTGGLRSTNEVTQDSGANEPLNEESIEPTGELPESP